jgi:hypothetical protein
VLGRLDRHADEMSTAELLRIRAAYAPSRYELAAAPAAQALDTEAVEFAVWAELDAGDEILAIPEALELE